MLARVKTGNAFLIHEYYAWSQKEGQHSKTTHHTITMSSRKGNETP